MLRSVVSLLTGLSCLTVVACVGPTSCTHPPEQPKAALQEQKETDSATTPADASAPTGRLSKEQKAQRLEQLTKMQRYVTQEDGTEPAFNNKYWDNKRPGIYVDIVDGNALFASVHKYDSKTGWPSFDRPLEEDMIYEKEDLSIPFTPRVEVRSTWADSHLGHVFQDGPKETTGLRYCINSAALRFVPLERLEAEGYGQYLGLFPGYSMSPPGSAKTPKPAAEKSELATMVLAGGCFWCIEADLEKLPGVVEAVSGFAGGKKPNPSYEDVAYGRTTHLEVVEVHYDPARLLPRDLLRAFFRSIDPLDKGGQFCDRGPHYRTAIFVADDDQRALAEEWKSKASKALGAEVVTDILPLTEFYRAPEEHQDYYKHGARYVSYRKGCKRDERVKDLWGKIRQEQF